VIAVVEVSPGDEAVATTHDLVEGRAVAVVGLAAVEGAAVVAEAVRRPEPASVHAPDCGAR
jgi:hypothetical protein